MKLYRFCLAGIFACTAVYLFVSAPPPLEVESQSAADARPVDVEQLFNAVNAVNDAARGIFTSRIVGPGGKVGLEFGEDWAEPGVEKGPLPALFLRLTAAQLEAKPPQLGLYLGSDEPINKSNLIEGEQVLAFNNVKLTRAPVFSYSDTGRSIAMFPDFASAGPCVSCHNEHLDSPKTDWELNDVMGATTWTYPSKVVGAADYLASTEALFQSIAETYARYLKKAADFENPVNIGTGWPVEDGRALPNLSTFMSAVRSAAADEILDELILISTNIERTEAQND